MKINKTWQLFLKEKNNIFNLALSLLCLILVMSLFSKFVILIESRSGISFNDVLLSKFNAINLTLPIFLMIYLPLVFALFLILKNPYKSVALFKSYALMVIIRIIMMGSLPLDPPRGMILLKDPLVELFGATQSLTKDLFFSGHTATLFLLFFYVPKKFKSLFLFCALSVMSMVLLQKVHYTIDVLVAPFVSYACFKAFYKPVGIVD